EGSGVCDNALDWCSEGDIERQGNPTCMPTYQSASVEFCSAQLECAQPATVSGRSVTLREWVSVQCSAAGDGDWACNCPSAGAFNVTSDTAWDACGAATSQCSGG